MDAEWVKIMEHQTKKILDYLEKGGVNGILRNQDASRPSNSVDSHNGMDAPSNHHSSESQILIDIAKAILLRED